MADQPATVGQVVDTASIVTKLVGDLAQSALTVTQPVLDVLLLLQAIAPVAAWIPVFGPIIVDISSAIPIIQAIARYAPQVSQGLEQQKPLVEAVAGVGDALLAPLKTLMQKFPQLPVVHPFFASLNRVMINSEFTPQDPMFDRFGAGSQS